MMKIERLLQSLFTEVRERQIDGHTLRLLELMVEQKKFKNVLFNYSLCVIRVLARVDRSRISVSRVSRGD